MLFFNDMYPMSDFHVLQVTLATGLDFAFKLRTGQSGINVLFTMNRKDSGLVAFYPVLVAFFGKANDDRSIFIMNIITIM